MLHPELRRTGSLIRRLFRFKTEKTFFRLQRILAVARRFMGAKGLCKAERFIQTPENPRLRLCVYTAKAPKPGAVGLLWIHGGGYAIGAPEQDTAFFKRFIAAANCVVVSPDYRLSTQAPYPAAIEDCYGALLWMKEQAAEWGIRTDQLFVGGDSAGGGLAAALALMARDRGEVRLAFQMPLYPMLDDRMQSPSARDNDAPIWDAHANGVAWRMYLGDLYGQADVPAYAAPARETDYSGLPPAYTYVGDIEPFCDETKEYAANLRAAGVQAELDVYPGCFHAFDTVCPWTRIGRQAARRTVERFQYAAAHHFAAQPTP